MRLRPFNSGTVEVNPLKKGNHKKKPEHFNRSYPTQTQNWHFFILQMWDWNITICTVMKYTSLVKKGKVKHIKPQTQSAISCCYQLHTQKMSFIRRQVQDFSPKSLFWSQIPNFWEILQRNNECRIWGFHLCVGWLVFVWGFCGVCFLFFLILTQVSKNLSQLPEEQILSRIF